MRIPEIETRRTVMRAFTPDDVDGLAAIFSSAAVMRFMPGGRPRSRQQAEESIRANLQHWEDEGFGWWAVTLKDDLKLIGWSGLSRLDKTAEVETMYMLDEPYWGRGLASETARAALRYAFEELGLARVAAVAVPENVASRRVMERVGMFYQHNGHYYGSDLAYYSIGREQFDPAGEPWLIRRG